MRTLLHTSSASPSIVLAVASSFALASCAPRSQAGDAPVATALAPHDDAEAMQRMMAAATPSEQHAWLLEEVGSWKGTSKSWPAPGAEAFEEKAQFVVRSVLGGRFIETTHRCDMPDMPAFEAIVLTGYDNAAREFVTVWIDSFGTTMMTGTGARSNDGTTLALTCTYFCPMRGKRTTLWQSFTRESKDRQTHRMWSEDMATGQKYLMAEGVYERQAG